MWCLEVDRLVQQWLPMLQIERLNWKFTCLYVILKFADPLMRTTLIGNFLFFFIMSCLYPRHCNLIKVTIFLSPSVCIIMLSFLFFLSASTCLNINYLKMWLQQRMPNLLCSVRTIVFIQCQCRSFIFPVSVGDSVIQSFDSNFYDDFSAFHIFTTWCSITTDCYSNLFTPSTIQYFMFPGLTLCIKQGHCLILISFLAVHLIFSWGHCRLCRSLLAIHLP